MKRITRRDFVKSSTAGGLLLGLQHPGVHGSSQVRAAGPNSEVCIAVIGLGDVDAVGGVGARGFQLIRALRAVPGVKIVALCDVDKAILNEGVEQFQERGENVAAHVDLRRVFDDKNIDAVVIATPNHWHALATVWACQAGKDVYVEKPFSHNIWEGRQMVAAARKYGRMVQVGTQRRSSEVFREAFEFIQSGSVGPIRCVHAIVYRAREGIGKVDSPTPVPPSVDYDLWCGPVPKSPLMRKQLHYEWHWFWATGNGEIGNNGAHTIDVGRWALGQDQPPPRAMSIGGRFGVDDVGETPNTQIAIMDYQPAPLICEVRNLSTRKDAIGKYRGIGRGVLIDCEDGYFIEGSSGGTVFDKRGKKVKEFRSTVGSGELGTLHVANFVEAVRSRKVADLNADAVVGHLSASCCHMANISHRLGRMYPPEVILEKTAANPEMSDAFERCRDYLQANGVNLSTSRAVLGPWVTLDVKQQRFVNDYADEANKLSQPAYREPFVVPQLS